MRDERRVASVLVEREAIAGALRDGDAERAEGVLRRHLQPTLELLRGG